MPDVRPERDTDLELWSNEKAIHLVTGPADGPTHDHTPRQSPTVVAASSYGPDARPEPPQSLVPHRQPGPIQALAAGPKKGRESNNSVLGAPCHRHICPHHPDDGCLCLATAKLGLAVAGGGPIHAKSPPHVAGPSKGEQ